MSNQETLDFNIPMSSGKGTTQSAQPVVNNNDNLNNNNVNAQQENPNQKVDFTNFLQHASHPCVLLFTLIFKVGAIIRYIIINKNSFLFLNLFISNEPLTFIVIIICSAFDFWFVKNVSGRYSYIKFIYL